MDEYYFCFDVGGTTIKAGVVDGLNNILGRIEIQTMENLKIKSLARIIYEAIINLEKLTGKRYIDSKGIGIGVPGIIDIINGKINCAGNLGLDNYPLKSELQKLLQFENIKIRNDVYVATLAELKLGAGTVYDNFVMIALGTGIGGNIVLNNKILDKPCELGHIKVTDKKIKCGCGEFGCFEAVASTKALVNLTRNAMDKHRESRMWEMYNLENVSGKTVFDFCDDGVAKTVLKKYIENLGKGIVSLVNIFNPDAVVIGGTISCQKDNLIKPLEIYVKKHIINKCEDYNLNLLPAKMTKDSGMIGARYLFD